ncbi:MAG: ATP phosphoribosyltransferase regulatory subunit [Synechococcaceae cyanobacterium]|jgi:ATP phosphoribosyltransferase regulatory subunit
MALQPAAGVRDLNPREVERQRRLCDLLAEVYRLWGYQEVAPPTIERLDTLQADGAIPSRSLVRLAADEPLGLRPECTASIARAAATRLAEKPRPLRLWACGTTFRSVVSESGGLRITEDLQSGVELLGVASAAADTELIHLLLAAAASLGLEPKHQPTLLVGHQGLLTSVLQAIAPDLRPDVRRALTDFDPLALAGLDLAEPQRRMLEALLAQRGAPQEVVATLRSLLGCSELLDCLESILAGVAPLANRQGVRLQLDPTFQPHFDLYDGLVLKLVCQGPHAPVEIASGGRYDALVGRFNREPSNGAHGSGTGFAFSIEAIAELLGPGAPRLATSAPWLVAAAGPDGLLRALGRMAELHASGEPAELCPIPCRDEAELEGIAKRRGSRGAVWLAE